MSVTVEKGYDRSFYFLLTTANVKNTDYIKNVFGRMSDCYKVVWIRL